MQKFINLEVWLRLLTRSSGHLDQAWSILETCDLHPRQRGMALSKVGASGWPGPSGQRPCDPEAVTSRGTGRDFSAAGGLSWIVLDLLILLFFPKWSESRSVMSDSLRPHGLYSPWDSPDQNTGVGSLSLPHGIFPTQRSNPGLLHCRRILYQLSHKGSPKTNLKILNVQICQSFPLWLGFESAWEHCPVSGVILLPAVFCCFPHSLLIHVKSASVPFEARI